MKNLYIIGFGFLALLNISCGDNDDDKNSGFNKLQTILEHQDKRFQELDSILAKNIKYQLKFPGKSADEHRLGTGIATDYWAKVKPSDGVTMVKHIAAKIKALMTKYPGRITFGFIGDYKLAGQNCDPTKANDEGSPGPQSDGTFIVHIWGANEDNFNLDNNAQIWGAGQASCFSSQRKGVFGISTMPPKNKEDKQKLIAKDKLLSAY